MHEQKTCSLRRLNHTRTFKLFSNSTGSLTRLNYIQLQAEEWRLETRHRSGTGNYFMNDIPYSFNTIDV